MSVFVPYRFLTRASGLIFLAAVFGPPQNPVQNRTELLSGSNGLVAHLLCDPKYDVCQFDSFGTASSI